MEKLRQEPRICQIIDYGVSGGSYYIATAWYRMSLKSWRTRQQGSLSELLALYLNICAKLIDAVACMEEHQVVHYDLKVSSFLQPHSLFSRTKPSHSLLAGTHFKNVDEGTNDMSFAV